METGEQGEPSTRLRVLRTARRLSQRELAQRAGLSTRNLQRIEAGSVQPSIFTLRRLAEVLGVDFVDLLESDTTHQNGMTGRTAGLIATGLPVRSIGEESRRQVRNGRHDP